MASFIGSTKEIKEDMLLQGIKQPLDVSVNYESYIFSDDSAKDINELKEMVLTTSSLEKAYADAADLLKTVISNNVYDYPVRDINDIMKMIFESDRECFADIIKFIMATTSTKAYSMNFDIGKIVQKSKEYDNTVFDPDVAEESSVESSENKEN